MSTHTTYHSIDDNLAPYYIVCPKITNKIENIWKTEFLVIASSVSIGLILFVSLTSIILWKKTKETKTTGQISMAVIISTYFYFQPINFCTGVRGTIWG